MEDLGFIREGFYIDPPAKDASPDEWQQWVRADDRKAAAAKAKYTKSLDHSSVPVEFAESTTRKVDGKWTQTTNIGFSGDFEAGNGNLEIAVEGDQDKVICLADMEARRNRKGSRPKGRSATDRRRRAKEKKR